MAGIVARLPFPLSGRSSSASTYGLTDVAYSYAIGGMPFLSAINDERPMTRSGAPMRKEQVDQQQIPGEQSLAAWWLRSQASFIGGQGVLYQDPSSDNQYAIRYAESVGVNPWVNGRLTLLRETSQRIADATANRHHLLGWSDGTDRYWSAVGNVLKSDTGAAITTITWGGANTIRSLTSDGTNYYAADNVQVYRGAGNGAGAAWTATGTTNALVRWVKGRIMVALDNALHETTSAGVKTLRFTHLNSAWTWTDMAEGTNAIYASGYAGSQSDIYKLVLDTSGNVPTLASGGIIAAQLPRGEVVHCMTTYLGTFIGIGTSRGFRVGEIDEQGDIKYGPLLIENSSGVKSIAAYDRFFFVACTNAIESKSGLYRVDLGQPIQDNGGSPSVRYAYATDLQAKVTGEVSAVTVFGNSNRMALAVTGQGSYLESASVLEASGYLKTGRVRYNTLEPKIYKFVTVKTPTSLMGSVGVSVIDAGGADTSIITVSEGSSTAIEDVILTSPATAAEWIQLKLTLSRSAVDTTEGGEINGWQLKAMPGSVRQRVFTIPLLCFDKEKDRHGQMVGSEGRTRARLESFEQLFAAGDAVSFQDLADDLSYLVVIDDYKFEQKAQPGTNRSNYGGVLWVELRTIADVITA
ncbi:hypothetical protein AS594_07145 [Streptomyces agglomeratus]|uniref:Uncharacterized protein n=1 Tax=Streptomyces agglomeratus TaxID=285458 RepID=A0A1E5P418_9ACTN|nr:hypothetical protein [Streptomyces agglomeratus]OEJ24298.1 hypothetical protein AS594_07145 [Streptomyces agglomeratus]